MITKNEILIFSCQYKYNPNIEVHNGVGEQIFTGGVVVNNIWKRLLFVLPLLAILFLLKTIYLENSKYFVKGILYIVFSISLLVNNFSGTKRRTFTMLYSVSIIFIILYDLGLGQWAENIMQLFKK